MRERPAVSRGSPPLAAGIGLDVGEPADTQDLRASDALNLAARLCAAARPGEVLEPRLHVGHDDRAGELLLDPFDEVTHGDMGGARSAGAGLLGHRPQ